MNILLDHAIILIVVDGLSPSGKATDSDSVIKGSNPFSPVTIKALIESAFLLVHLKRKAKLLMLKVTTIYIAYKVNYFFRDYGVILRR